MLRCPDVEHQSVFVQYPSIFCQQILNMQMMQRTYQSNLGHSWNLNSVSNRAEFRCEDILYISYAYECPGLLSLTPVWHVNPEILQRQMLQHLANEDTAWRQDVNSDTLKIWWQFEMQCVFNNNYRYIFSSRGQHSLLSHAPPWECSHHHPWHWWVLLVLVLHTTAIPQPNLAMVIRNTKYKRLLIHSECFILIHVDQTSLNCSMDLMYINVCNIGSATSNTYTYIICFPITSSDRIHCRIL